MTTLFFFLSLLSPSFTDRLCCLFSLQPLSLGYSLWTLCSHISIFFYLLNHLFDLLSSLLNPFKNYLPCPVCLILSLTSMSSLLYPSLSSVRPCVCLVSGMLPFRLLPPWSTSRPQPWRALGPWSGSRASNSLSLTSPLRVLTTPQSPLRAWASCTQAQAAGAHAGAHAESGGVRLEPPGAEVEGQVDQGQILAAGITWWSRSGTEGWTSSRSCEFHEVFYSGSLQMLLPLLNLKC